MRALCRKSRGNLYKSYNDFILWLHKQFFDSSQNFKMLKCNKLLT